jgi:hypothetical protein
MNTQAATATICALCVSMTMTLVGFCCIKLRSAFLTTCGPWEPINQCLYCKPHNLPSELCQSVVGENSNATARCPTCLWVCSSMEQ